VAQHLEAQFADLAPKIGAGEARARLLAQLHGPELDDAVERDERGGWRMVDPSALPANLWKVEHLLQVALAAVGSEVPESERDAALLGFEPPRIVLEIEELLDGQSRHERIEVGALDADGRSVNVRVRGHFLRVRRDLDTALDRQLDEFKTELALEFTVLDVVRDAAGSINRYPDMAVTELTQALAATLGVPVEHVATGTGSAGAATAA
jgi:hypothetical protein